MVPISSCVCAAPVCAVLHCCVALVCIHVPSVGLWAAPFLQIAPRGTALHIQEMRCGLSTAEQVSRGYLCPEVVLCACFQTRCLPVLGKIRHNSYTYKAFLVHGCFSSQM